MSNKKIVAAVVGLSAGFAQAGTGTFTYNTTPNLPVAPDNGCIDDTAGTGVGGITHTINITDTGTIQDLNLELQLTQTWRGDIQVGLSYSGGGSTFQAINNFDTSGDNLNLVLDDEGALLCSDAANCGTGTNCVTPPGPVCRPNNPLSAFDGLAAPGVLTITVCDRAADDTGDLLVANLTATLDTVAINADLSITKTDGVASVAQGGSTTYTITASNAGPDPVTGATVADTFPADCTVASWSCAAAGGGACTGAGSGNINDTAVNLPAGASVTYTATCAVSGSASSPLANTATIAAPAGVVDPTPGNNSATDSDTVTSDVPPQFAYAPAPSSTVSFIGGTTVGSTGSASIDVTIGTAGAGAGAPATTTTSCNSVGTPFSGFTQTVTATGPAGSTNGGPLSGTCVLAATVANQTLTCTETRGGAPTTVTFNLECPAGTAVPLTSTPVSGSTVTLPQQTFGGPGTTQSIVFQNPGLVDVTVTCTAPTATQFTIPTLSFNVPAGGTGTLAVNFSSSTVGNYVGVLDCSSSNGQNFSFNLAGSVGAATSVPTLSDHMRGVLSLILLTLGLTAVGLRNRRS
ncbi:hypothetical protein C7S18_05530 [Ahniella affigens]|uniref:DUF11 domain-containing protein n=1 Tax=Ahniella affigens TaxID=2021234 RepID=A0A2P1PPD3_9GAMM|nr:DUF11 domain-containing protein [Ahniella affigens]AVP96697.1 hypothetical protein C7S18_05530 [Ahniella affigens]